MAQETPQTRVWLVNAESVMVDGGIEDVRTTLKEWWADLAPLTSGDQRVYVRPEHVTHIEDASGDEFVVEAIPGP